MLNKMKTPYLAAYVIGGLGPLTFTTYLFDRTIETNEQSQRSEPLIYVIEDDQVGLRRIFADCDHDGSIDQTVLLDTHHEYQRIDNITKKGYEGCNWSTKGQRTMTPTLEKKINQDFQAVQEVMNAYSAHFVIKG